MNEQTLEKVIPIKFKKIDIDNLKTVQQYYRTDRGLDLKDSTVVKMLLADKASELRKGQNKE